MFSGSRLRPHSLSLVEYPKKHILRSFQPYLSIDLCSQVLPDEKTLKSFVEKMVLEESNRKDNQGRADLINTLIIKKGK